MDEERQSGGILELALLSDIDEISAEYCSAHGARPVNLSHWDQSISLKSRLQVRVPRATQQSAIDYAFSYTQPNRDDLVRALGFEISQSGCLLSHSGSSAIVAVVHWLKATGRKRVVVVGPRYFTVPYALTEFGLEMQTAYCKRSSSGYDLPDNIDILARSADAIWITNPVYCTSCDYYSPDIDRLKLIAESGIALVLDECLSEANRRLAPHFSTTADVTAIFAPHKSICVNGMKFAAIIFAKKWQDMFDAWADVWLGCLPMSSALGVKHFLAPEFLSYSRQFKEECQRARALFSSIVSAFPTLSFDREADGYLVSVFAPSIPAELGLDFNFLKEATQASGATFIAGLRNQMDPSAGLSFRVNLAALDEAAQGALHRLCFFLERETLGARECSIK